MSSTLKDRARLGRALMAYRILSLDGGAWALIEVRALIALYDAGTTGHEVAVQATRRASAIAIVRRSRQHRMRS